MQGVYRYRSEALGGETELLEAACAEAGVALTLNRRPGYDHSYYFVSSFMDEHLRWHAARLAKK